MVQPYQIPWRTTNTPPVVQPQTPLSLYRPSALHSESSGLSLPGAPTLREPIYPPLLMPTRPITTVRCNLMCTYVAPRRDGLDYILALIALRTW